ncbi:MAG: hypothetical protein HKN16_09120 [Saprospiraceae bacterium]|nr:hypothetical protein [Saprospiraceae bacterium]
MTLDKHDFLVTGPASGATREKIRLKLRLLLNKYKNPKLIITNYKDDKLNFEFDRISSKHAVAVYKTSSIKSVKKFWADFIDLYNNEWTEIEEENLTWVNGPIEEGKPKGPFHLIISFSSARKGY